LPDAPDRATNPETTNGPPGPPESFYPRPIELSGLRPGAVNVRDLGEGVQIVVISGRERLHVFREICPHMGGPLGKATVCKDATLECPWHGYRFSLETGRLVDNPNERIMADLRRRAPECFRPDKAPRYALTPMTYQVVGCRAYVQRRRSEP
jgi:nitrite reductase (NADH) small subunit/3-phenylpropionate/trans-cinnamate dioxygenase ferredoxin subunit